VPVLVTQDCMSFSWKAPARVFSIVSSLGRVVLSACFGPAGSRLVGVGRGCQRQQAQRGPLVGLRSTAAAPSC